MKKLFFLISMFIISALHLAAQNANQKLSNLNPTAVNRSLVAKVNDSLDLGSATFGWRNLYLTKGIYLSGVRSFFATGTNNGVGLGALNSVTSGIDNTAVGYNSSFSNTTGSGNTSTGKDALYSNLIGNYNTAVGRTALYSNTVGNNNTAIGLNSMRYNTEGDYNTGIGDGSLYNNTTGNYNTAAGYLTLYTNTSGYDNSAFGKNALRFNTSGYQNAAIGEGALYNNTTGYNNTASGTAACNDNTTGHNNTGLGYGALQNNTSGSDNTAVGSGAGSLEVSSASGNSSFGSSAGSFDYSGNYNTVIGYDAERTGSYSNSTALGYQTRATANNQVKIGNSSISSIGGYVSWSDFSDGRFKKNIKENIPGLAFINKLRPITYTLDIHAINAKTSIKEEREEAKIITENERIIRTGFVAQEVEKTSKELGFDFNGVDKPKNENDMYGLRYAEFVVPLVKAVQELSKQNDELKERLQKIESLISTQSVTDSKIPVVNNAASPVNIYPNPAKDILYIQSKKNTTFYLSDATGKTVITKQIIGNGSMDVSGLATGTYFLKNNATNEVQKIMVAR